MGALGEHMPDPGPAIADGLKDGLRPTIVLPAS
jgi:hypothetical protein